MAASICEPWARTVSPDSAVALHACLQAECNLVKIHLLQVICVLSLAGQQG